MSTFSKSIVLVAGCAAALCGGLAMARFNPEHAEPATKPKLVKAAPKTAPEERKTHGSQIEAVSASEGNDLKPSKAVKSENKPDAKTARAQAAVVESDNEITAEDALSKLQEGNARWMSDQDTNPRSEVSRRELLAEKGQKPFVTILTCADSRIPVERVFDQGVGDVFVVRVAGNIAGISETATIEYGAGHLKTPLLVVMGHTKCGAVGAAASGAAVHGMVAKLVGNIQPAVERTKRNNPSADDAQLAALCVKENVWQSVFDLYKNSDELRKMVSAGKLKVVGAVYDIGTGKVEFLGEHPWQGELLGALKARGDTATADVEKH